jgi:signal transduction histidine kinase
MPEHQKESAVLIETLSMHRILEGLIHNINTPLNVIIGYAQQLQKQYPEIASLDKIKQAGLEIDDMIKLCSDEFVNRMDVSNREFELNKWMSDEVTFLKNILDVKHSVRFEVVPSEQDVKVHSNPLLLSLFFESLVLHIKNNSLISSEDKTVSVSAEDNGDRICLNIKLPDYTKLKTGLEEYLRELQTELESSFELMHEDDSILSWDVINTRYVKIYFKR